MQSPLVKVFQPQTLCIEYTRMLLVESLPESDLCSKRYSVINFSIVQIKVLLEVLDLQQTSETLSSVPAGCGVRGFSRMFPCWPSKQCTLTPCSCVRRFHAPLFPRPHPSLRPEPNMTATPVLSHYTLPYLSAISFSSSWPHSFFMGKKGQSQKAACFSVSMVCQQIYIYFFMALLFVSGMQISVIIYLPGSFVVLTFLKP